MDIFGGGRPAATAAEKEANALAKEMEKAKKYQAKAIEKAKKDKNTGCQKASTEKFKKLGALCQRFQQQNGGRSTRRNSQVTRIKNTHRKNVNTRRTITRPIPRTTTRTKTRPRTGTKTRPRPRTKYTHKKTPRYLE